MAKGAKQKTHKASSKVFKVKRMVLLLIKEEMVIIKRKINLNF